VVRRTVFLESPARELVRQDEIDVRARLLEATLPHGIATNSYKAPTRTYRDDTECAKPCVDEDYFMQWVALTEVSH
jgi:hypothetical protein